MSQLDIAEKIMAHFLRKISFPGYVRIASIAIASLMLLASGLYVASLYFERQQKTHVALKNHSDPMLKVVVADGRLEPLGETMLLSAPFGMESARVQQIPVKEGDHVQAGTIVAVLDSYGVMKTNLDNALDREQIARARLNQVKAGAKSGEIEAQRSRLFGARAELSGQISTQQANIANLTAQLEGERRTQQATIQRLGAELTNTRRECERYTSLFNQGAVAASLKESTCLGEYATQKRLDEAKASLYRTESTLEAQISAARENLKRTIGTLNNQVEESKATFSATAEVRPEDVAVSEAELNAAISAVEQARANMELTLVRMPMDAQILEIHAKPGEVARTGIANIGMTKTMVAVAEVYETDIRHVKIGQKAIVKSPALNTPLYGHISQIGLNVDRKEILNDDPVVAADARIIEVRIKLDNASSQAAAALTNLKVDVTIDI
jgi:ABC exporter DevB family membrane fusion protein